MRFLNFKRFFILLLMFVFIGQTFYFNLAFANKKSAPLFIPTANTQETKGTLNAKIRGQMRQDKILHNHITALAFGKNGQVYLGTVAGLSIFTPPDYGVGSGEVIKNFTAHNGLDDNFISSLYLNKQEQVWIGTTDLPYILKDDQKIEKPLTGVDFEDIIIYEIVPGQEGVLWLATNKGLIRYTVDRIEIYNTENSRLPINLITTFAIDNEGIFWLGSNGMHSLNPEQGEKEPNLFVNFWQSYFAIDELKFWVNQILPGKNNDVWFATNRGLFHLKKDKWEWENFTTPDLPSENVTALAFDKNNNLWLGTTMGAAKMLDEKKFQIYNIDNGLINERINTLAVDSLGNMWFGTNSGVARLHDERKWLIVTQEGISEKELTLREDQVKKINAVEEAKKLAEEKILQEKERQEKIIADELLKKEIAKRKGIFTDLKRGNQEFTDKVFTLYDRGILSKKKNFLPEQKISREEFLTAVIRAINFPAQKDDNAWTYFVDLQADHWAIPYINASVRSGIIDKARYFNLGKELTRFEAVEIALKAFGIRLEKINKTDFEDLLPLQIQWVETAIKFGIISGFEEKIPAQEEKTIEEFFGLKGGKVDKFSGHERIKQFQMVLKYFSFYNKEPNGKYDSDTINAVADYQLKYNLADYNQGLGVFGKKTSDHFFQQKVIIKKDAGTRKLFKPDDGFTRTEMVEMIYKLISK